MLLFKPMNKTRKNNNGFGTVRIIIVVVGIALLIVFAGWYVYKDKQQTVQPTISTTSPTTSPEKAATSEAVVKPPTLADINSNIEAAMNSGNLAALESYMAPTVMVLIWSSEGPGPQTPAQAVTSLAYLNTATTPWDFNLPASFKADRIDVWTSYFTNPATALVGKSANDKLIMINFDNSGQINVIIMAFSSNM